MAANARDLITNKCYHHANSGNADELKKQLREEKAKSPKRIPYFFSASKQYPGKFLLGYQPGSRPRVEYLTVIPDGFRYRNRVHDGVNDLIKWFKAHYQDPVPRPVQPSSAASSSAAGGGAQMHGTPYTPTHLAYNNTPTPQYTAGGQQYVSTFGGQRGNVYQQRTRGGQQFMGGQFGGGGGNRGGGGGGGGSWRTDYWGAQTPSQTPGRTPAYTPTQTPNSVSSMYGTTPPVGGRGGSTPRSRHGFDAPGTPLRDE